jgi:hypothetical protein
MTNITYTDEQLAVFVDFAALQYRAETCDQISFHALVKESDLDKHTKYYADKCKHAAEAVDIARSKLGLSDEDIRRCHHRLLSWADNYTGAAA